MFRKIIMMMPKAVLDFSISPSYAGKSNWSLTTDGPLDIGVYSTVYVITALRTVNIIVKMWGAGGAPGGIYTSSNPPTTSIGTGGGGGYSTKTITITSGSSYTLYIGRGGRRGVPGSLNGSGATYLSGGVVCTGNWGTEGGGLTGFLSGNSSYSQGNALLIAGGGGAGGDTGYGGVGGAGGGSSGVASNGALQGGGGGTSSAGGSASSYNGATAGSAMTGGHSATVAQGAGGGGGGGYYGGGGSNVGGGGGGSGYAPSGTTTAGSTSTPGNSGDAVRNGAGQGGSGSTNGADGRIYISL